LVIAGFLSGLLDEAPEAFILAILSSSKDYGVINRHGSAGGIDAAEIRLA